MEILERNGTREGGDHGRKKRKVEVDKGEKKGEIIFHLYITAGLKVITSWNLGLSLARGLGSLSSDLSKCSVLGIKSIEM